MKQNKQLYVAPKVELIEMEMQGVLCSSAPENANFTGTVLEFDRNNGAWVL